MPPTPYTPGNIGSPVTPLFGQAPATPSALPWGAGGGNLFSGDLAGSYQSAYNSALAQNQSLYQNIAAGYQNTMAQQRSAQDAISSGYNQLYNQVLGGIQGVGQSQAQQISDVYAQQQGKAQQDLINRGLGNSTVLSSVQRGLQFDQSKSNIALANQMAQLQAGYQSQLGTAGLNYANQAAMQNTALSGQELNWMNTVSAQYPNAQAWLSQYQQQGAAQQAAANRALFQKQLDQQKSLGMMAMAPQGGGRGFSSRPPAPDLGPMGGGGGAGAGMLSTVTPYGLGGVGDANFGTLPGAYGGGGLTASTAAGMATSATAAAAQAAMASGGDATGDQQWQQGAYGPQNASPYDFSFDDEAAAY